MGPGELCQRLLAAGVLAAPTGPVSRSPEPQEFADQRGQVWFGYWGNARHLGHYWPRARLAVRDRLRGYERSSSVSPLAARHSCAIAVFRLVTASVRTGSYCPMYLGTVALVRLT